MNEPATVRIDGRPAAVDASGLFVGGVQVAPGTTRFTVTATDAAGNTATQQYDVDQAGASKVFTFDANGNLTSDGTRTFEWDARNQLGALNVGTRRSQLAYDGIQRRVRVVEKEGGITQSDMRLVQINYFDPTGLKISCLPSVTWTPVNVTTGCVGRPDACAFISRIEGRPTECKEDCGKWKFDAYITMDVVVEYSIPLHTRSRQTPGATLEQHENLHVADYFGLCRDFSSLIKTEGFSMKPLCEAARQSLNYRIGWYTNDVLVRTKRHDSLPIR